MTDDTTRKLEQAMSEYWRAQGEMEAARERAYEAIRAASTAGMSLRAIGELTDLSHQRVAQILGYQPPSVREIQDEDR
jgi:hypothetical protein